MRTTTTTTSSGGVGFHFVLFGRNSDSCDVKESRCNLCRLRFVGFQHENEQRVHVIINNSFKRFHARFD